MTGGWVSDRLEITLHSTESRYWTELGQLVGLALRHNPRRAHLLVSTVLGKHVPTDPRLVLGAGRLLGHLVDDALTGAEPSETLTVLGSVLLPAALTGDPVAAQALLAATETSRDANLPDPDQAPVVLGYAETATALGHSVADVLNAPYLHSTRRAVPGVRPIGDFEEEHSHATSHALLPEDPELFTGSGPLVLVDDELSTGRTALNTIEVLQAGSPRERYVIAALVDLRSDVDRQRMAEFAARLGVRIEVVALLAGRIEVGTEAAPAAERLVADLTDLTDPTDLADPAEIPATAPGSIVRDLWPAGVREGGRHGFTPPDEKLFAEAVSAIGTRLAADVEGGRVLVLGFEELMYAPLRIAVDLAERRPEVTVRYSTTTRSPVLAVDEPGYPIRTKLSFPLLDRAAVSDADSARRRYVYNVAPGTDPERRFDEIVLIVDRPADGDELFAAGGLLAQLASVADRVRLVVLPDHRPSPLPDPLYGPDFGSYRPDEVAWLLTDLSGSALEAPTEEREERVQSGGHYAESLPEEYQPGVEYQQLFEAAVRRSAARVAYAVGVVTERVLAERGPDAVLVSLARAGTPSGVLVRRWARLTRGLELPHYTASIVRGRGIDPVALRYLAAHHDPASVMFVDGWTGKGAISRELSEALDPASGFRPDLAVLADPGGCVSIFGTRDDYLIPSACLNSTVSGLISRTVLNQDLIGSNDFHGGKFYRELQSSDVSNQFLDAVSAHFPAVRDQVTQDWDALSTAEREPTWAGWAAVEQVSAEFGIGDVNLVKPGVGETTRVLLRRVPWKILVRTDAAAELDHVRWLAEQRGVELVERADLPYSCIGLIHPRFTRGATGSDGTAVRSLPGPGTLPGADLDHVDDPGTQLVPGVVG